MHARACEPVANARMLIAGRRIHFCTICSPNLSKSLSSTMKRPISSGRSCTMSPVRPLRYASGPVRFSIVTICPACMKRWSASVKDSLPASKSARITFASCGSYGPLRISMQSCTPHREMRRLKLGVRTWLKGPAASRTASREGAPRCTRAMPARAPPSRAAAPTPGSGRRLASLVVCSSEVGPTSAQGEHRRIWEVLGNFRVPPNARTPTSDRQHTTTLRRTRIDDHAARPPPPSTIIGTPWHSVAGTGASRQGFRFSAAALS